MLSLTISTEDDPTVAEMFKEGALWRLVSFRRNHTDYEDPAQYFIFGRGGNDGEVYTPSLTRSFDSNTAFLLDHYEHSGSCWSLHGEGMQCRWDTAKRAGLLLANYSPRELQSFGIPKKKRVESARDYLKVYNDWSNGAVFEYGLSEFGHCSECGHTEEIEEPHWNGPWYGFDFENMFKDIRSEIENRFTGKKITHYSNTLDNNSVPDSLKDLFELEKKDVSNRN